MDKKELTAILLSGGKSTRMGKDKKKLNYKGSFLIDTIVENLARYFNEIVIVSNEVDFFKDRYNSYDNNIIIREDIIKNIGPCAGLYTGLISSSNEDNFLMACDMPYFSCQYLEYLENKEYKKALVYDNGKYLEPFFALYKKELFENIKIYLNKGRRSINGFLNEISAYTVEYEEIKNIENINKVFRNLNYPQDWKNYLEENGKRFD
ncbi:molybdenum cofactor guanylyltransferase [Anaerococcus sp. AGMB00486]|uniref:Probable molybdenum cofactor guanylyltransferase n=2 Tax=Anaerococcus TaxID=165779 RepID=A0ABX2N9T1_9FIRM|nr:MULTISPECIES: molybdenum cofactor guanylyltransferase [Anaerococcus]MDY3005646.1 molybdenum cofactor guanylyltransferase [Anaerococcus porci]MSS78296.1 molybdenum cofactor guanylyltransferase [Anaerococcus porci]NVF11410.1 molybdenum cofactor guanylyltransferase [Anaerococcus faecalis]